MAGRLCAACGGSVIRMKPTNVTGPMDRAEAQAVTDRIRGHIDAAWADIERAYEGRAWKALGYASWEAYVRDEFDMSRRHSYRLIDQARVIHEIAKAAGEDVTHGSQISERTTREIKKDLPAVTAEIKQRVEAGEEPEKAVKQTVDAAREAKAKAKAEREANQAEHDRQREEARAALPDSIKSREQAKADAIAAQKNNGSPENPLSDGLSLQDRIDELEEAVRVLEAENADLKAENKLYGEMKVQYEKGGFDKVVAGRDEEIRVLQSRLYQESSDKASWMKSAKYWQAEAKRLGWSNGDFTVDLETGEIADA